MIDYREWLGKRVKDEYTRWSGLVTCVSFYADGEVRVGCERLDGQKIVVEWFSARRLTLVDEDSARVALS